MADNKYISAIEQIKIGIRSIIAEMDLVDKKITSTASKLASISGGIKANTPNQFKEQADQITKLQRKIEAFVKTQSSLNTKLHDEKKRTELEYSKIFEREQRKRESAVNKESSVRKSLANQRNREQKQRESALNKESSVRKSLNAQRDKELKAQGLLGSAYERLIAKQKMAKKTLHDLISAEKQNKAQIDKAQVAYNKYTNKVNKANKATSNFSKNSLGGLVKGFKNLIGAFGIVGAATMFASFVKSTIDTIKELDKLDFTLRTVIKNEGELARTRAFLTDTTLKYGLEIVNTTERYIKFMVAARQSGLELKKVERIFSTFAEAGATLGLKTHELQGIFLALEQMLSKGKVTTEELRRQLGERLPGAMDLMAKALGVTTSELDKMLKAGEVLSADAIPKLTETLREFYNLTGEGVDTLQASTSKLSTSWTLFIDTLNKSTGVGHGWQSILDGLASGVRAITSAFGGNIVEAETEAFASYSKELQETDRGSEHYLTTIEKLNKEKEKYINQNIEAKKSLENLKVPLFGMVESYTDEKEALEKTIGATNGKYRAVESYIDLLKKQSATDKRAVLETILAYKSKNDIIDDSIDLVVLEKMNVGELRAVYAKLLEDEKERGKYTIPYYEGLIKANEDLRDTLKSTSEEDLKKVAIINKENEEYKRNIDLLQAKNKREKESKVIRKGSIGFLEELISRLENEQKTLATSSEEYGNYTKKIEAANGELIKLKATLENISVDDFSVDLGKGIDDAMKRISELSFGEAFKTEEAVDDIFGFDDMLERTKDSVDQAAEYLKKKNIAQYWADEAEFRKIDESVKAVFDTFSEYYDLDLEKFEFLYDGKKDSVEQWVGAINEVTDAALDASLNRYDIELQEAQRSRDLIINNELASEKEKRIANEKFDEEERRIKTERAKKERQNTLIKIAVDTAAGVALALAQTGTLSPLFIPAIIGIGLAQAAIVASQPLPKFAEGTKAPLAKDTLAIVGDGGRQEAITENGKLVGVTPDTPTLMNLKKGQEVQKDAHGWIDNAVYRMNMESNGEMLSGIMMDNIMHDELRKMRADSKRTWEEVKKLAHKPYKPIVKAVFNVKQDEYKQ